MSDRSLIQTLLTTCICLIIFFLTYQRRRKLGLRGLGEVLFFGAIFTLPMSKGLTFSIGPQWEAFLPFVFLSSIITIIEQKGILRIRPSIIILLTLPIVLSPLGFLIHELSGYFPPLSDIAKSQFISVYALASVEQIRLVGCVLLCILCINYCSSTPKVFLALRFFVFGISFSSLTLLYELFVRILRLPLPMVTDKAASYDAVRAFGSFYEPTTAGVFMLAGIISFLVCNTYASSSGSKPVAPIHGLLMLLGLIGTFSFTAFASGVLSLALIGLLNMRRPSVIIKLILVACLFFITLVTAEKLSPDFAYQIQHTKQKIMGEDSNIEAHRNAKQRIYDLLFPNTLAPIFPIFGIGTGLSAVFIGNYSLTWRIVLEHGYLGTLCFLLLILYSLWHVFFSDLRRNHYTLWSQSLGLPLLLLLCIPNYYTLNSGLIWFSLGFVLSLFRPIGSLDRSGPNQIAV